MLQAEYEFVILWGKNRFNIFFRQIFGSSRFGSGFFGYRFVCKRQYGTPHQVARTKGNEHHVADPIQESLTFHYGYPFNKAWANTSQDGMPEAHQLVNTRVPRRLFGTRRGQGIGYCHVLNKT